MCPWAQNEYNTMICNRHQYLFSGSPTEPELDTESVAGSVWSPKVYRTFEPGAPDSTQSQQVCQSLCTMDMNIYGQCTGFVFDDPTCYLLDDRANADIVTVTATLTVRTIRKGM